MSASRLSSDLALTTSLLIADREPGDDTSMSPPLDQSVNYRVRDIDHLKDVAVPMGDRYYTRRGNPTSSRLARVLAQLEGAESGIITASGMGALSTAILALVRSGDHVIGQRHHYSGTTRLLERVLPSFGIETTRVDPCSVEAFTEAIRPNTKLIVLETPVNPLMQITDLRAVCTLAKAHGILTLCDSTFATPVNQRPIALGVDVVMHSVTKYIGGHHDLLAGALLGARTVIERIWDMSLAMGAIGAPFNSWLALRGIRTLALRMEQHNTNAQALAEFLEAHASVARVFYPGLASHPQHDLATSQMSGFGGLLTFELAGGYAAAASFLKKLRLVSIAGSLGGVSSTATQPAALFGEQLSPEAMEQQGITCGMIRFAAGIENPHDLLGDVAQAL